MIPPQPPSEDLKAIRRNVYVAGRRTSVSMEPVMWDSLQEIGRREALTRNQLCSLVDKRRGGAGLTPALRVFIVSYFRAMSREEPRFALPPPAAAPGLADDADPILTAALKALG